MSTAVLVFPLLLTLNKQMQAGTIVNDTNYSASKLKKPDFFLKWKKIYRGRTS